MRYSLHLHKADAIKDAKYAREQGHWKDVTIKRKKCTNVSGKPLGYAVYATYKNK